MAGTSRSRTSRTTAVSPSCASATRRSLADTGRAAAPRGRRRRRARRGRHGRPPQMDGDLDRDAFGLRAGRIGARPAPGLFLWLGRVGQEHPVRRPFHLRAHPLHAAAWRILGGRQPLVGEEEGGRVEGDMAGPRRWTATLIVTLSVCALAGSALAQRRGFFYGWDESVKNIPYDGRFTFVRIRYTPQPGGYWAGGSPSWV